MPDKLDFLSSTFKNSQAKGIVKTKPNNYSNKRKKGKTGDYSGLQGLARLNPKMGSFGKGTV